MGVAVSGGADSVALLRALHELAPGLGVVLRVLHLNHRLRGAESDADQSFVVEVATQLSLELIAESSDVAALASERDLSLEAAGRRARYEFFLRAAMANRLDCVATAHTLDDQAETVLLRLLRGAGTSGLAGILRECSLSAVCASFAPDAKIGEAGAESPAGVGARAPDPLQPRLIRPFLSTSRQEVEDYLLSLHQSFRHDASNRSPRFLRNRVRAELVPALERDYNPLLRQALCETAEIVAAENAFLEDFVSAALANLEQLGPKSGADMHEAGIRGGGIEVAFLQSQPVALQRRILRRLCQPHGLALDFAHLERMREFALAGCAGSLQLPRGFAAEIVRGKFLPPRLRLRAP